MKIRTQFVSNSSSSSYVVYVPSTLDWEEFLTKQDEEVNWTELASEFEYEPETEIAFEENPDEYNKISGEQLAIATKELFEELQNNQETLCADDYDYSPFNALVQLLDPFTIAEVDATSGEECIIPVDVEKIRNLVFGT